MNETMNNEVMTDVDKAWEILMACKTNVRVAVQISPAVRVAIGDAFGLQKGEDAIGKAANALLALGVDLVVDGSIAGDALTLALAGEVQARMEQGGILPVVFSNKTEWLRQMADKYGIQENVVFPRPAEQALATEIKKLFLPEGKRTYVIAIVPCECKKNVVNVGLREGGKPAVDLALTAVELAEIFRSADLDLKFVPAIPCDEPFGVPSGSGYIYEIGGGIAEGVMRSLASDRSAEGIRRIEYSGVRGYKPLRVGYGDVKTTVVCAENADEVFASIANGSCSSAFVEIVGGAFGCVAGNGLPETDDNGLRLRAYSLYSMDRRADVRSAVDNEATISLAAAFAENEGNDGFDELEVSLSPFEDGVGEPVVGEVPVVEEEAPVVEETVAVVEEAPAVEEAVAVVEEAPVVEEVVVEAEEVPAVEEAVAVVEETPAVEEEAVEAEDAPEEETEEIEERGPKTFDANYRRMSKKERRKMKRAKGAK